MRFSRPDSRCAARQACGSRSACRPGITLAELLIVIAIISILGGLVLSTVSHARLSAQSARCLNNLHGISVAFSQYAIDNDNRYPDPLAAGQSWESLLQKYMGRSTVFACPADEEIFPSIGSSYDWRDTPNPATTLAGRRLLDVTRSDAVLAFETLPGWHGKHLMNSVLVNGAVVVMDEDACVRDLHTPVVSQPWPSSSPAHRH